MINIFIADDHKMIIDGLKALLVNETDITVVGEALSGNGVISFLKKEGSNVNLLILDINMPEMDGIETTKYIKKNFPKIKILVLSMYNKPVFIRSLIEEGISGYILKNTGKEELILAITKVYHGEEYFSSDVTKTMMSSFKNPIKNPDILLTKRELEILKLLAKAHTTAEIAEQLFVSTYTIDTHRKNLLSKLNVKNTPGLVKYAIENGLTNETY